MNWRLDAGVGHKVIAILAHLRDHKEAVRKIVTRLAAPAPVDRAARVERLFILAGLRRLEETVEEEARKMPTHFWDGNSRRDCWKVKRPSRGTGASYGNSNNVDLIT